MNIFLFGRYHSPNALYPLMSRAHTDEMVVFVNDFRIRPAAHHPVLGLDIRNHHPGKYLVFQLDGFLQCLYRSGKGISILASFILNTKAKDPSQLAPKEPS